MLLRRTNSYIFVRCAVKRQVISWKYFKTYITYIYILLSGVDSSFWTPYTCLTFQQRHIQNPFKHLRWSVFACPVNNFKLLTVCAKILSQMLEEVLNTPAFGLHLAMFCVKCLMGYFEFLYGLGIICLPLNIPEKLH